MPRPRVNCPKCAHSFIPTGALGRPGRPRVYPQHLTSTDINDIRNLRRKIQRRKLTTQQIVEIAARRAVHFALEPAVLTRLLGGHIRY